MFPSPSLVHTAAPSAGPSPWPPFQGPGGTTRIPTKLPPLPTSTFPPETHIQLDGELVPVTFVRDSLRDHAHDLLESVRDAVLDASPADGSPRWRCASIDPALLRPSHALEVYFDDGEQVLDLVGHASVLATSGSPVLTRLLREGDGPTFPTSPEAEIPGSRLRQRVMLPVVSLRIPCTSTWYPLHHWLYTRSPRELRLELVGSNVDDDLTGAPQKALLARRRMLVARLDRVRQLWLNAAALEMQDQELERVMGDAWASLNDALLS